MSRQFIFMLLMAMLPPLRPAAETIMSDYDQSAVNIEFMSALGGKVNALIERGNTVYLGQSDRLRIIDVSDRKAPRETGALQLDQVIYSMGLYQSYLYLSTHRYESGYGVIQVIDVSQPSRPRVAARLELSDRRYVQIHIWNKYLIISGYVSRLDDPLHPEEIYSEERASVRERSAKAIDDKDFDEARQPVIPECLQPMVQLSNSADLRVAGTLAYVIDEIGFKVIDVADPRKTSLIKALDLPGKPKLLAMSDHLACVATEAPALQLIDLANPKNPVLLGSCQTQPGVSAIAATGNHAFLALGGEDRDSSSGLQVVDLENARKPRPATFYPLNHPATDVKISDARLYLAAGGLYTLALDTSDTSNHDKKSSNPILMPVTMIHAPQSTATEAKYNDVLSFQCQGNRLFARKYRDREDNFESIYIYDAPQPTTARQIGRVDSGDVFLSFRDFTIHGTKLYLSWWHHLSLVDQAGITIHDYTQRERKRDMMQYCNLQKANRVEVQGDMIYVADGEGGLVILKCKSHTP